MSDKVDLPSGGASGLPWDGETKIRALLSITDPKEANQRVSFFAENAVLELPYRPAPAPSRFEGLEAIRNQYGQVSNVYRTLSVRDIEVHRTVDPLVIFVYWTGENELVNGYIYVNRFHGHFQFDASGKLVLVREFYDPVKVVALFNDNPDVFGDLWQSLPEGANQ
jgi:ketosteroid isomerase-like protein